MEDTSNDSVKYVYNMFTGRLDPVNDKAALMESAAQIHRFFESLVKGGFTESQAMQLIVEFLVAASKK